MLTAQFLQPPGKPGRGSDTWQPSLNQADGNDQPLQQPSSAEQAMCCCRFSAEPWAACEECVPAWTTHPGSTACLFQAGHMADAQSIPATACLCCEMPLSWLLALCGGGSLMVLKEGQDFNVAGWEGSSKSLLVLPLLQCRTVQMTLAQKGCLSAP